MSNRRTSWTVVWAGVLAGLALAAVLVGVGVPHGRSSDVRLAKRLPDGSVLVLKEAVFVATNYTYTQPTSSRWLRFIAPALPKFLRNRISLGGGGFGFGLENGTNLVVITVNRSDANGWFSSKVFRLRVLDEAGNSFDACWGANTLAMPGQTTHGWDVRAFPRRTKMLRLQFLAERPGGGWTNAAEFRIPNELFRRDAPQWKPEPLPITHHDGDLAVTLKEFQSGAIMGGLRGLGDEATAARKTRMVFTFAQNGQPSTDWLVQKVMISDATGNRWSPYLDFVNQEFNWVTNGTVEFFGALWPGEAAWALEIEASRIGGFQSNEVWQAQLPLPSVGTVSSLTSAWTNEGATATLVGLASPNTEHPGNFRWLAKWWGPERDRVYSLAVQLRGNWQGRRLKVVKVTDQAGAEVKLMGQQGGDGSAQAVFLRPNDDSLELRLILALPRSRFVKFLAVPELMKR